MDLSTIGATGGASINEELITDIRTGNMGKTEDGVDEKPSSRRLPSFNAPAAIRDAEQDAILRISFCVDTQGSAYEIKILEESPTGKGLAESGKQALMQMQFNPAQKNGKAVSFCGMEAAFEVKYRDENNGERCCCAMESLDIYFDFFKSTCFCKSRTRCFIR